MTTQPIPPQWSPPPATTQPPPSQPPRRPWYKRTGFVVAAGTVIGIMIGGAIGSSDEPQAVRTVTVTSIVEQQVFTTNCVDLDSGSERQACEAASQRTKAAATTTPPATKPPATTKPAPPPAPTFSDGTYEVGSEIKAGTYKTRDGGCYWERLKGFSGDFEDIIANDNTSGPGRMTIRSSDKGVMFSGGCTWTKIG